MGKPATDLLQLLANPSNRAILSLLLLEPQYPRRLSEIVGLTEDEASRRLRAFEKAGLAKATWENVGKTVRMYRLATSQFTVSVTRDGLNVGGLEGSSPSVLVGSAAETAPRVTRCWGRDAELQRLSDALERERAICVHGIGGVGKTTLVAQWAARSGRPVVWHTLVPSEPGSLLVSRLAANLRATLEPDQAQRLADLGGADEAPLLLRALLDVANRESALIVLDRFEVAGDGCVERVAEIAAGLDTARLVVVGRAFPKGMDRGRVAPLPLDGLNPASTQLLLSNLGVAVPEDAVPTIHARTRGHPLALVLMSMVPAERRAGGAQALVEDAGIRDFLVSDVLPQLAEAERDALVDLSILHLPFLASEAEAVAATRHAVNLLQRLEARGFVSRAGETYAIHDLVRGFLANQGPQRGPVHARAAAALKASGEPAKVLEAVHHHLEAGAADAAGALVLEDLTTAPYRFLDQGLAPRYRDVLARLSTRTLRDARAQAAVELELTRVHFLAGDADQARVHLASARDRLGASGGPLATALHLAQARILRLEGDTPAAAKEFAAAEASAARAGDSRLLLEALVEYGSCEEERSDVEASRIFRRAIDVGRRTTDARLLSLAYSGAARVAVRGGNPEHLAWAQEGLRLARLGGFLRGEVAAIMALAVHFATLDEVDIGFQHASRYLEISRQLGDPWFHSCALIVNAQLHNSAGQPEKALPLAKEALDLARTVNSRFYERGAHILLAETHRRLGHPAEARRLIAPFLEKEPAVFPLWTAMGWRILADLERAAGNAAEARKALRLSERLRAESSKLQAVARPTASRARTAPRRRRK